MASSKQMAGRGRRLAVAPGGQRAHPLLATARRRPVALPWRVALALLALSVAGLLAACGPEASRTRGGGLGADIGNRGATVQMHGSPNPYFQAPAVGKGVAP
jgi:hypothetical protein